ncbi:6-bladed beta-propeller, partial [Belliella pelovolcani]|uniref:6-bladed beta-propeller n=1 Tax=Belliella pelovolcani TaxID=529505 RepID=UPI00391D3740
KGSVLKSYFSSHPNIFYRNMGDPVNFYESNDGFYFTRTYVDTLYRFTSDGFKPEIIFDFGKNAMNHEKMKEKQLEMDDKAFREYFQENSGASYSPFGFSNSKYMLSRLSTAGRGIVSIFDKQNKTHDLVNFNLINDIDESFDFYPPVYQLEGTEVSIAYRGPSLYNKAVEKKQTMSDEDWKAYQAGKGKDFIEAAFYGKETENYVLMILKTKK